MFKRPIVKMENTDLRFFRSAIEAHTDLEFLKKELNAATNAEQKTICHSTLAEAYFFLYQRDETTYHANEAIRWAQSTQLSKYSYRWRGFIAAIPKRGIDRK